MIKKQSIINFSHCRSKGYASVVLIVLRGEEDTVFCPFLCCFLLICGAAKSK